MYLQPCLMPTRPTRRGGDSIELLRFKVLHEETGWMMIKLLPKDLEVKEKLPIFAGDNTTDLIAGALVMAGLLVLGMILIKRGLHKR